MEVVVQLGAYTCKLQFEVLDVDVQTILGMPFLENVNPTIDWVNKTIKVKHFANTLHLPVVRTS